MPDEICRYQIECEVVHAVERPCHPQTCPEVKRLSGKQCPDPVGEKRLPIHNRVFRDPRDRLIKKRIKK
jgi:hypothetical protein